MQPFKSLAIEQQESIREIISQRGLQPNWEDELHWAKISGRNSYGLVQGECFWQIETDPDTGVSFCTKYSLPYRNFGA